MAVSKELAKKFYETMSTIRCFEESVKKDFLAGEIPGFVHLYIGEEAIGTGICAALRDTDLIESTHRGHGHCIAKGAELNPMMAELYGKATGYCKGKGGSQHIADFSVGMLGANGIVGGGFGLAVGAALAARYQKSGAISVVFFGDGACNRGTFHESANMAAAWKLPVIFVCENNGIACSTPHESGQQAVTDLAKRAVGYDMASYIVNGNDFFDVYYGMKKLVDRARNGEGNCCGFLECKTHRAAGHMLVGDTQPYRDAKVAWAKMEADDCIKNFERRCIAEGWLEASDFPPIHTKVDAMVEEAKQFAINSPYPDASELFTDLYD